MFSPAHAVMCQKNVKLERRIEKDLLFVSRVKTLGGAATYLPANPREGRPPLFTPQASCQPRNAWAQVTFKVFL